MGHGELSTTWGHSIIGDRPLWLLNFQKLYLPYSLDSLPDFIETFSDLFK